VVLWCQALTHGGKHWRMQRAQLVRFYLTECDYQLVLESQLPHKIVNLLFKIAYKSIKLTVLWKS
jgi:hypothetical protein